MIVRPSNQSEMNNAMELLRFSTGTVPSGDMQFFIWTRDSLPLMVVCFNAFIGKTCQMHVATKPGYKFTPRAMLDAVFKYAFIERGCERILAVVNSRNEPAMRYDQHVGFYEMMRMGGMHDDGGDMVLLAMDKAECKYLPKDEE